MGDAKNDVPASIASLVLAIVAGSALGTSGTYGWTHPFMHVNLTAHGIIGLLHYQSGTFGVDTSQIFPISLAAAKYLALPGLNSDLYRNMFSNQALPIAFVISGVIPLYLELIGKKNDHLGRLVILGNVIALGYYAINRQNEWPWYTLGCAILALLAAPVVSDIKVVFPLACAGMDYCAHRVYGSFSLL